VCAALDTLVQAGKPEKAADLKTEVRASVPSMGCFS
jgi:hypothetical protein